MLFYDYFHHDKFPNLHVSLVSELHNYSTRSASSNQRNPLETNHPKKCLAKHSYAGTLLNTNENMISS